MRQSVFAAMPFGGLVALALAIGSTHCSSATQPADAATVSGTVVDEQGKAIANATVSLGDASQSVRSGSDGRFSMSLPAGTPQTVTLNAEDASHARVSRLANSTGDDTTLVLHAYDTVVPVTLPSAGEAPVTVSVSNPNGTASVTVAAGSLVRVDGSVASGPAEMRLAYWAANDDHIGAPSVLWGNEADGTFTKLDSFGMVDFTVVQNGNALQVAGGQNVLLTLPLNADQNIFGDGTATLPNAYYVDPTTGVWTYAGAATAAASKPSADAEQLGRHLAVPRENVRAVLEKGQWKIYVNGDRAWNIDLGIRLSAGGCVTGRTVDACTKQPVGNMAFTKYFLNVEEIASFEGLSNSAGTFCTATPFSTWSNAATQLTASVKYIITKKDDASQTAYCNPAAKYPACFRRKTSSEPGKINYVSDCRLSNVDRLADQGIPLARYNDTCVPHAAVLSISPCTFCSAASAPAKCTANSTTFNVAQATNNGSCTQLGDVPVPTPTCPCDNNGNCKQLCKTPHVLGSACFVDPAVPQNADRFIACCSTDTKTYPPGSLQCLDAVCIATSSLGGT